jgi:hypothetical protein
VRERRVLLANHRLYTDDVAIGYRCWRTRKLVPIYRSDGWWIRRCRQYREVGTFCLRYRRLGREWLIGTGTSYGCGFLWFVSDEYALGASDVYIHQVQAQ